MGACSFVAFRCPGSPCTIDEEKVDQCLQGETSATQFDVVYPTVPELQDCPPKDDDHTVTKARDASTGSDVSIAPP
eukprot:347120-Amphidinium_carterae.1